MRLDVRATWSARHCCRTPKSANGWSRKVTKLPGGFHSSESDILAEGSHGWRWVDRSGWTPEEEVENVKKAINGENLTRQDLIF
jgi:hypothetical protein